MEFPLIDQVNKSLQSIQEEKKTQWIRLNLHW
jgi:hypothetical protein